jgi:hypothetical protein
MEHSFTRNFRQYQQGFSPDYSMLKPRRKQLKSLHPTHSMLGTSILIKMLVASSSKEEIQVFWKRFLTRDLPIIKEAISEHLSSRTN